MNYLRMIALPLIALAITAVSAAIASTAFFPVTQVDLSRGESLFRQNCAFCHSVARGASSGFGPNLSRIGETAASRVPGLGPEEYILESILTPNRRREIGENRVMPNNVAAGLSPTDIVSIVGYLCSLGGEVRPWRLVTMTGRAISGDGAAESRPVRFDRVLAGRDLFLNKGLCVECHPLRSIPSSNLIAPSLLSIGIHDREYLTESIRRPSEKITSGYEIWQAVLTNGRVLSGRMIGRRPESVTLLATSPQRIATVFLADIDVDEDGRPLLSAQTHSSMPIHADLSDHEIDSIVEFLKSFN